MASIIIRELPHATKERLRAQAARLGLSLEAHTRQLLQRAATEDIGESPDSATLAQQCFGNDNGVELQLPPKGKSRDPISFD